MSDRGQRTTSFYDRYLRQTSLSRIRHVETENMNTIHLIREQLHDYNRNFRIYSDNVYHTVEVLNQVLSRTTIRQEPLSPIINDVSQNVTTNDDPIITSLFYTVFPLTTATNTNRLNRATIDQAIERVTYDSSLINRNTSCPIMLDDFNNGDPLIRLRHCGHMFREPAIQHWFTWNVRCPVCRHDIREVEPNPDLNETNPDLNETNPDLNETQVPPLINENRRSQNINTSNSNSNNPTLLNNISSLLTSYINRELRRNDISMNQINDLLYTFDIDLPFLQNDFSRPQE